MEIVAMLKSQRLNGGVSHVSNEAGVNISPFVNDFGVKGFGSALDKERGAVRKISAKETFGDVLYSLAVQVFQQLRLLVEQGGNIFVVGYFAISQYMASLAYLHCNLLMHTWSAAEDGKLQVVGIESFLQYPLQFAVQTASHGFDMDFPSYHRNPME